MDTNEIQTEDIKLKTKVASLISPGLQKSLVFFVIIRVIRG